MPLIPGARLGPYEVFACRRGWEHLREHDRPPGGPRPVCARRDPRHQDPIRQPKRLSVDRLDTGRPSHGPQNRLTRNDVEGSERRIIESWVN